MTVECGLYRHFKGNLYRVLHIARHSETEQPLVIYQALYGDRGIWARPLEDFAATIERDGRHIERFARLPDDRPVLHDAQTEQH